MAKAKNEVKHTIYKNGNAYNCDPEEAHCSTRECDCDEVTLSDERMNLNIPLKGRVVAIAKLGLWNGTRQGYKLMGDNVRSIFDIMQDYNHFYSDGKNIVSEQIHHDGRNFLMYRELRTDRTEEGIEKFLNHIYNGGEITPQMLTAYTRSLQPYVAKVYGW